MSRLWGRERTSGHSKIITNILFSPKSKNSPICIVSPPPVQQHLWSLVFNCAPSHCLLWPSLLLNMSGRKHLRCSLALFAPAPDSNHLAKLRPRNCPQIGPFLGQNCLFVGDFFFQCPNQCWPFIGILWQPARNHSIWVAGVYFVVIYTSSIISNADASRKNSF